MSRTEFEEINAIVRRYIDVYEFRITPDHLEFYFTIGNEKIFEKNFDNLRQDLKKKNLVPITKKKNGEYMIIVIKTPTRRFFGIWVNLTLLIITILSTIWVGMGYYESYYGKTDLWHGLFGGLIYFSIPLLAILGTHEMAHYFAARRHHIAASLPFFIPAPTMLGTLGAFISIREPIPDKKSLIDVGLSGPIAGFLVAIPVTIIGLMLGNAHPPQINSETVNSYYLFNVPLMYEFLQLFVPSSSFIHPVAMAGWVGFVVTAINLFPVGQLDGGHVARALLGENAKYVSYGFAALLLGLGFLYPGWLIFGILVIFLGLRHPPPLNEIVKLDKKRIALAVIGFIMLSVTFVPVPVEYHQIHEEIQMHMTVGSHILIMNSSFNSTWVKLNVSNEGDMKEGITLSVKGDINVDNSLNYTFSLEPKRWKNLLLRVNAIALGNHSLIVKLTTKTGIKKSVTESFTCLSIAKSLQFQPDNVSGSNFNTTLINTGKSRTVSFLSINNVSFNITNVPNKVLYMQENDSVSLNILVLGNTTILAIDYGDYEVAMIKVMV